MEITIREAQQNRLWRLKKYSHYLLDTLSDKAIEELYNEKFNDEAL